MAPEFVMAAAGFAALLGMIALRAPIPSLCSSPPRESPAPSPTAPTRHAGTTAACAGW